MRLYLDDNITDRRVVTQLQRMGHFVCSQWQSGTLGSLTPSISRMPSVRTMFSLPRIIKTSWICDLILTAGGHHQGLLLLYTEHDPTRDMTPRSIAVAITRVEAAGYLPPIRVYVLNHWR